MSTTSVAPEQQRSSSGRTTPRRPSRHCALDDASFDDLVAMGQNIDDLPVEDYGTTADIDVYCCQQMNDIDQLQPYLSRIGTGKMVGSHSDTMGEYHCLHTDSSECRKSPASRLLNYDKLMSPRALRPTTLDKTLFVANINPDAKVIRILEYRAPHPSQVSLRLSRNAGVKPVSFWVTIDFRDEYYQPMVSTKEGDDLVNAMLNAVNNGLAGIYIQDDTIYLCPVE